MLLNALGPHKGHLNNLRKQNWDSIATQYLLRKHAKKLKAKVVGSNLTLHLINNVLSLILPTMQPFANLYSVGGSLPHQLNWGQALSKGQ